MTVASRTRPRAVREPARRTGLVSLMEERKHKATTGKDEGDVLVFYYMWQQSSVSGPSSFAFVLYLFIYFIQSCEMFAGSPLLLPTTTNFYNYI